MSENDLNVTASDILYCCLPITPTIYYFQLCYIILPWCIHPPVCCTTVRFIEWLLKQKIQYIDNSKGGVNIVTSVDTAAAELTLKIVLEK